MSDWLCIHKHQLAVDAAVPGDTVKIKAGHYHLAAPINTLGKAIAIVGEVDAMGHPVTVLSGDTDNNGTADVQVLRCVSFETSTTLFINLIIDRGQSANGGGMYNGNSSPLMRNCWFTNCIALVRGGGMLNSESSNPILVDCWFMNNQAPTGGGMANEIKSNARLINCQFDYNYAYEMGGGMLNVQSDPYLDRCFFWSNEAPLGGGMSNTWAVPFMTSSNPQVYRSEFHGNIAAFGGGGVYNEGSMGEFEECFFVQNTAIEGGGMQSLFAANPLIDDCEFTEIMRRLVGASSPVTCLLQS